jgi:hypothetical protein
MRRSFAGTVAVAMAAMAGVAGVRCASFGDTDDGSSRADAALSDAAPAEAASGVDAAMDGTPTEASTVGPCWPPPVHCPADQVCCLDFAASGQCVALADCPSGRTHVECRTAGDCPSSRPYCCSVVTTAEADSGYESVVHNDCVGGPSACGAGNAACTTTADCDGGACAAFSQGKYPMSGILYCP